MAVAVFSLHAEIRIYKGWSTSYSDCIATYENGRFFKGWSTSYSDCVATIEKERLYKGWSTSYSDCILTDPENILSSPPFLTWFVTHFYRNKFK